ncbi:MAG: enoyl-CoA hydratase/isomerase family protein [Flavobacteriaceae bacterium]
MTAVAYEFIETGLSEGLYTIRLARPPVNVLHAPMMAEIEAALDAAENDPDARTVVITGHGMKVFSAGVEIADHTPALMGRLIEDEHRFSTRVRACTLPTIAALNGLALGGGLELALSCDMLVSVPDAKIGHPEIKLASIAFPGILMLQGRLPGNHIAELLTGGEPISGAQAHRLGLVNALIDPDDFQADVMRFASRFTSKSRPVLQLMVKTLKALRGKTLETGFAEGSRIYMKELLPLEDVNEGLAAFAEKRPPVWKHR